MVLFAPDGQHIIQAHVVHPYLNPCPECGQAHPKRVCVLPTWPPSRWMHTKVQLHRPGGPIPPRPDPPPS